MLGYESKLLLKRCLRNRYLLAIFTFIIYEIQLVERKYTHKFPHALFKLIGVLTFV